MEEKKDLLGKLEIVLTAPSRWLGKTLDTAATSPFLENAEQQIPKTLTGIAEAPVTLATGLGGFVAGMAGQAAKTAHDMFGVVGRPELMSAGVYDLWRSGFRNVSGEGFKPREVLKKFGENKEVFDNLMSMFTVEPKTPEGEHVVHTAMAGFDAYERGVEFIGKQAGMSPKEIEGFRFFARLAYPKIAKIVRNVPSNMRGTRPSPTNRMMAERYAEMEKEGYSPKQIEEAARGEQIWSDARRQYEQKKKEGKKGLRDTLVHEFVDVSGNMKRKFGKITRNEDPYSSVTIPKDPLPIHEQTKVKKSGVLEINDEALSSKTGGVDVQGVPASDRHCHLKLLRLK